MTENVMEKQIANEPQNELNSSKAEHHQNPLKRILYFLLATIVIVALAMVVATFWLPVLEIYGNSMNPTLQSGDIVVAIKSQDIAPGDIVAFELNNKILVKRVIAGPNDTVIIDENGKVFVNDWTISEPYLSKKVLGQTNIEFPYQVPDNQFFVAGDNREYSVDSRNTAVGCISKDQLVGKLVAQVWPLSELGLF